jgi:phosphohistidine phosphatase
MASHWKKENLTMPDLIISSPATRTIQTTELFCSFLNINFEDIMVEASLYEAWINEYQQLIYSIENHIHNIWIVAHNPTIAYAVTYFSAQEIETFPTTAMANVQFESDDWKKVGQESGKCNFILTPKQFKGSED